MSCPGTGVTEWPCRGQREPRGREHRLWPSPPSRGHLLGALLAAALQKTGRGTLMTVFCMLTLSSERGGEWLQGQARGFAGGGNLNLTVSYV